MFQNKLKASVETILEGLPEYYIAETTCHPFNAKDLEKRATCVISRSEINAHDGINDTRLGVINGRTTCDTCHQKVLECPGHIGIIKLHAPFVNPRFIKHVISVLRCICHGCGELFLSDDAIAAIKATDHTRLFLMAEASAKMSCNNKTEFRPCRMNPSFSMTKNKNSHVLIQEYKLDKEILESIFPIGRVISLLNMVSGDPVKLKKLGFTGRTRPIDYVIQNFFVVPPCSRPQVYQNGEMKDDYITNAYRTLVLNNERLKDPELSESERLSLERDTWNYATHIMDNSDGGVKQGKAEPIKGCKERLVNKDGLARSSQSRRTNYTGRTVAGPSSGQFAEYLEIPESFREHHTIPEFVGSWNVHRMNDLFEGGRLRSITYGSGPKRGRKFIISSDNTLAPPAVGDTVERWSQEGDYVLMCRQPTLTKYSNMAHRIKHTDKKVIGVGCPPTQSYNMDFDGDEANVSKSQTIGARVEAAEIMSVEHCIMAFKNSQANMGILYNGVTSAYLLSTEDIRYSTENIPEILDKVRAEKIDDSKSEYPFDRRLQTLNERLERNGVHPDSAKAVFSVTFPPDFLYERGDVLIRDGIFVRGTLKKRDVSTTGEGIIAFLHKRYSSRLTINWITEANRFLEFYIHKRGFSLGYKHIMRPNLNEINSMIELKKQEVQRKINSLQTSISPELFEMKFNNLINELTLFADKVANGDIDPHNPLYIMSTSGAKGNEHNTAQICSCLGQQFISGRLPEKLITQRRRCLPFYPPDSTDIKSRGFVQSSFMSGLLPGELFFHFMPSRLGLIDTAIKTADTGSISHRFIRVLEDYTLSYDGAVCGANGSIISLTYGDGFSHERTIRTRDPQKPDPVYDFIDLENTIKSFNRERGQ